MRADTVVQLFLPLPTSWTDSLCHLCTRGWVDPYKASEVTKSEKKTLNEIPCLKKSSAEQGLLTSEKPTVKKVRVWPDDAMSALKDCFECSVGHF